MVIDRHPQFGLRYSRAPPRGVPLGGRRPHGRPRAQRRLGNTRRSDPSRAWSRVMRLPRPQSGPTEVNLRKDH
jgi:hypothetical protein